MIFTFFLELFLNEPAMVLWYPDLIKGNRRMLTHKRLDLQIIGSQPVIMPKILPDHCFTPGVGLVFTVYV